MEDNRKSERIKLSAKEVRKRMMSFAERKNQFIASIRKDKEEK